MSGNAPKLAGFIKARVRLPGGKSKTVWGRKTTKGKLHFIRVWRNTGDGATETNELVVGTAEDIVWEKPAVYDLNYDEITLAEEE